MYITVKQAAEKWGISERRIRVLCAQGKINGAYQEGRGWKIPADALKPADGRYKSKESILLTIDKKKKELDTRRPLTEGEVERLNEEFVVEYTYNSNAIEGNILTLRETDLVLRGLTIDKKPLKDHMEAVGHKEAFDDVAGIMVAADMQGIGVLRALKESGKKVPEEVKVISLTGHAIGGMLETAMTSMELPGREMGQRAADMILEDIEAADDEKPSVQHMVFGTKLIERETT